MGGTVTGRKKTGRVYRALKKEKPHTLSALPRHGRRPSPPPHFYSKQKMGKEQLLEIFFYLPTKTNYSSN